MRKSVVGILGTLCALLVAGSAVALTPLVEQSSTVALPPAIGLFLTALASVAGAARLRRAEAKAPKAARP